MNNSHVRNNLNSMEFRGEKCNQLNWTEFRPVYEVGVTLLPPWVLIIFNNIILLVNSSCNSLPLFVAWGRADTCNPIPGNYDERENNK